MLVRDLATRKLRVPDFLLTPPPSAPSIFRYLDGSSITKLINSFDSMTTIEEGGMKWCHVIRGFEVGEASGSLMHGPRLLVLESTALCKCTNKLFEYPFASFIIDYHFNVESCASCTYISWRQRKLQKDFISKIVIPTHIFTTKSRTKSKAQTSSYLGTTLKSIVVGLTQG